MTRATRVSILMVGTGCVVAIRIRIELFVIMAWVSICQTLNVGDVE